MSEIIAQMNRMRNVEFEIDMRLSNQMTELLDSSPITADITKSLIVESYCKAIDDVETEDYPDISLQFGYNPPDSSSPNLPWWYGDPEYSPTDEEIVEYIEGRWQMPVEHIIRCPEYLPAFLRHAYGLGHAYASVTRTATVE